MNFQEIERYEAAGRAALKEYGMEQWRFELLHCSENATFLVTEPEHEKDGLAAGAGLVSDARKRVMRVARPGYHTLEELESEIRWLEKMWVGSVAPSGFFVVHFAMPVFSAVTGEGKRVAGASLSTSVTRYHKRKKRHNESADMSLSLMARSFFCCKVIISSISG